MTKRNGKSESFGGFGFRLEFAVNMHTASFYSLTVLQRPGSRLAALKAEGLIRQMSAGEIDEGKAIVPIRRTQSFNKR